MKIILINEYKKDKISKESNNNHININELEDQFNNLELNEKQINTKDYNNNQINISNKTNNQNKLKRDGDLNFSIISKEFKEYKNINDDSNLVIKIHYNNLKTNEMPLSKKIIYRA